MSERTNDGVRSSERQSLWNETDRVDCVPKVLSVEQSKGCIVKLKDEPDANKLDWDVDAKGSLELVGLLPADIIGAFVHLIGKRDLLEVASGKQTNFVQHASQAVKASD